MINEEGVLVLPGAQHEYADRYQQHDVLGLEYLEVGNGDCLLKWAHVRIFMREFSHQHDENES